MAQISDIVDSRHDSIKCTIKHFAKKSVISKPPLIDGEKSSNSTIEKLCMVNECDSYMVFSQLYPEFTEKLVDYWLLNRKKKNH